MGTQLSPRKGQSTPPTFRPICLLWSNGRPSQQLLSYCYCFESVDGCGANTANHSAASPIALAESSGAHRLQAFSPCVHAPSRSSTAVPRRRTQPAGQSEPPFHHVVIAVRSAYAAVNYRRSGLSSRCSPCLELSAAARHVCTVSYHLPKPSEDSPLQPLLSICQAREVISSLRPFLLLLLLVLQY